MFLTPDEVHDLTGKQQCEKQAAALRRVGIPFKIVGNRVKVLRSAVEAVMGAPVTSPESGPNWGAWDDRAKENAA